MDPVAWRWNDRHYPPPILPPGVGLVVGIKIYLQVTDDWWGGGSPGHTQPTHYPEVLLGRWGPAGGLIYLGWGWLEERSWGHISVFSVQYWQSLTVDTSERWQDHNDIRQGLSAFSGFVANSFGFYPIEGFVVVYENQAWREGNVRGNEL